MQLVLALPLSSALMLSPLSPSPAVRPGASVALSPVPQGAAAPGVLQGAARVGAVRMQVDFLDGYMQSDPTTGERTAIELGAKEKLYLDCLDAFYNEGGKQVLSDDEYEQLKLDLEFEGSAIAVYAADEIKFILANKRFSMGKAVLSDSEYDALRTRLKEAGSQVVLHDAPSCTVDGICKNDLRVDKGKQRLLYLPGTVGGMILWCELSYWVTHLDPLVSILLGLVPVYFGGKFFTENIFAQKPLATTAACPTCNSLLSIYFGDLLFVQKEGLVGPSMPPQDQIDLKCAECGDNLMADRKEMIVITKEKKGAVKA
jgi:hypothetical protein